MQTEIEGAVNVMRPPFFDSGDVPVGLEPELAPRLPARGACRGLVPVAAAPDAPRDLGVSRRDDAGDDGRVPRRRPGGATRAPPGRQNRPDMKPITVIVTASGAPGTAALLHALRANGEREVRLVGTDMSDRSVGRHLCDAFHLVPAGSDPAFPDAVLEIAKREGADAILPQSSFDLEGLAEHVDRFPMPVLVSHPDAIRRSNDKAETYELLHALGVPAPAFKRVNGAREVEAAARELGYPGAAGLLQAGVLVGLARLPDPRPDRRPGASAAERAARLGVDAPRGGGRAPARRGRPGSARDGARDRRRTHGRRNRERQRDRARAPEDPRGDARRPRDVLRHARRPGADAHRRT